MLSWLIICWLIPEVSATPGVYKAYIISVATPPYLHMKSVRQQIPLVQHVPATTQINLSNTPLHAQYLMDFGRGSHLEISNKQMIACFLSHLHTWHLVNETSLILEEDAYLDNDFQTKCSQLLQSITGPWDVIMLQARKSLISHGRKGNAGPYAFQCKHKCTWSGTLGYLVSPNGAKKLIRNMEPITLQVDAYISLLNMYRSDFNMLWSSQPLVHQKFFYVTKIWDFCLKCYVPENPLLILLPFTFLLITIIISSKIFQSK